MESIKVSEIKPGYSAFGNKGACWRDEVHIAKNGETQTLCSTPMLSSNHFMLGEKTFEGAIITECRCEECVRIYNTIS